MTCATKSGKRRSPISDIAYNSGEVLTDLTTGRTHARPHRDGTTIIVSDIVCALPCPYGVSSVSSAQRREQMYNELYLLNKRNAERVYWKTTIALPNEADDETLKSIAREIAFSFSEELERPIDFSVHKKPGNNHMHIACPERKYKNGWGQKSISYYINKDGSLNYEKIYKDADGNDIRMPRTINNEKPIYITDENGLLVCQNQKKDASGRCKWQMRNFEGLNPQQLQWMHEENDRIQNKYLLEMGKEQIHRNHPETTKFLKETEIKAEHLGRRDSSLKGESYEVKKKRNKKYEKYAKVLNKTFKIIDQETKNIERLLNEEKESEKLLNVIENRLISVTRSFKEEQHRAKEAITLYVEKKLRPEKLYTQHSLFNIMHKNNPKGKLAKRIREKAKMKWRGCTGWMRRNYLAKTKGIQIAEVYEEYLRGQNEIKPDEINDNREILPVTLEEIENEFEQEAIRRELSTKAETKKNTEHVTKNTPAETIHSRKKEKSSAPKTKPAIKNIVTNTNELSVSSQNSAEAETILQQEYEALSAIRDIVLKEWRNQAIAFYVEEHFSKMSKTYQSYYEDELNKLSVKRPKVPKKPNKEILTKEATKIFGGLRADLLKKKIKKLIPNLPYEYEKRYNESACIAKDFWKKHLSGKSPMLKPVNKQKFIKSEKEKDTALLSLQR